MEGEKKACVKVYEPSDSILREIAELKKRQKTVVIDVTTYKEIHDVDVKGDTYSARAQLRSLGFHFDMINKMWRARLFSAEKAIETVIKVVEALKNFNIHIYIRRDKELAQKIASYLNVGLQ